MPWSPLQHQAFLARTAAKTLLTASEGVDLESDLHGEIMADCRRRGWIPLHGRMDRLTGRTIGEMDFVILGDGKKTFFIECKARNKKPTTAQANLHAWAAKLGHTVYVVRNMAEYHAAIEAERMKGF